MRRATGASDDGAQTTRARFLGVIEHLVWHAMRRDHLGFMRNAEFLQNSDGMLHHVPIGRRPHDHAYNWRLCIVFTYVSPSTNCRSDVPAPRGIWRRFFQSPQPAMSALAASSSNP